MTDQFEYTHVNGVNSEALSLVAWNEQDNQMFVRFTNGNERVYIDVPEAEYKGLVEADSVGRYYNYEIYGQYDSVPVENAQLVKAEDKPEPVEDPATTTNAEYEPIKFNAGGLVQGSTVQAGIEIKADDVTFFVPNARIDVPKSKFGIRWTIPGTAISSEPLYEARDAAEALADFQRDLTTFLGEGVEAKITAVVHYFD